MEEPLRLMLEILMKVEPPALYRKYHLDRDDERHGMFELMAKQFEIGRGLYAGCFVHITPSFVIPEMIYVDSDKRAETFFCTPEAKHYVSAHKVYVEPTQITFIRSDYSLPLNIPEGWSDLLISQYAGFVSQSCKQYLRSGGYLLVNNSHGDASMANIDPEFSLVGVFLKTQGKYRLKQTDLDSYMVPKRAIEVTREYLEDTQRGVGYTKPAASYVFRYEP